MTSTAEATAVAQRAATVAKATTKAARAKLADFADMAESGEMIPGTEASAWHGRLLTAFRRPLDQMSVQVDLSGLDPDTARVLREAMANASRTIRTRASESLKTVPLP